MSDVTIKLTVGAFSAEVTGPAEWAENKMDDLVAKHFGSARSSTGEARSTQILQESVGKQLSPGEFVKKSTARTQNDQALLLGYYLEKVRGIASFTSGDLATIGKEIKRPFGNPSDVVAKLTSRGLVMSAGDKDGDRAYALTASGEEFVESLLEPKS